MADPNLNWNDAKLQAGLQKVERECVSSLAAHWTRAAAQKVSVSAGGNSKRARAIRRTGGAIIGRLAKEYHADVKKGFTPRQAGERAGATYQKFRHSKPGEPPRKITGFGQRSISWKMVDRALPVARAGLFINAMYMYFLETGFRHARTRRRVLPRPWAKRTFNEEMGAFRSIAGKLGGRIG